MKLKLQLLDCSSKKFQVLNSQQCYFKCSIVAAILDKAENMSIITENFSR